MFSLVWQWLLSKKVVATVCPVHFDNKSEQYMIVTNPVLGKNLEHPLLTRQCSDTGQVRWKMYP